MLRTLLIPVLYAIPVLLLLVGSSIYFLKSKSPLGLVMSVCAFLNLCLAGVSFVFVYMMNQNHEPEFIEVFSRYMMWSSVVGGISHLVFALSFLMTMLRFSKD